ncbi:MAG: HEPN domain-containing protein [Myxococcota bacterium]
MVQKRAHHWLVQAKSDLLFAKSALREGFYAQCCFICQQAVEKALKSALLSRGALVVLTHSLKKLCELLRLNGRLEEAATRLDQYYLSGRYPDALPDGAPCEVFTRAQAEEAVRFATQLIQAAKKKIAK